MRLVNYSVLLQNRVLGEDQVEIAKMRKLLEEERARLHAWAERGFDESERDAFSELSFEDQHPADVGSETFEREAELSIRQMVERQLLSIEAALQRIEDGRYGKCEMCGAQIPASRLAARPTASLCVEHQRQVERQRGL